MPHDRNGQVLAHGDLVSIPCRVIGTSTTEDYCNLVLESEYPHYPSETKLTFSVNAKQVERISAQTLAAHVLHDDQALLVELRKTSVEVAPTDSEGAE